jgi:hypothetical protein
MRRSNRLSSLLAERGFAIHAAVGRLLRVGFAAQCLIVAAAIGVGLLCAAAIDGSLVLTCRNVGLLQHPAIWGFLFLQAVLPLSIRHSLCSVYVQQRRLNQVIGTDSHSELLTVLTIRFLRLGDRNSRAAATAVYGVGIAAFVWNTFQNQRPGTLLPFDFWDSSLHPFGFWATRVYKLYLFGWLLPYVALIHIAIVTSALRVVRSARLAGKARLLPLHADGIGGLGVIPALITNPLLTTICVASLPMAGVIWIHRAAGVTPFIGAGVIIAGLLCAYVAPTLYLRTDLVVLKHRLIAKLRATQEAFDTLVADPGNCDAATLSMSNDALTYFDKMCDKVNAIPNYPQFTRLVKVTGAALTPSALSIIGSAWSGLRPMVARWLQQ